MNYKKKIFYTLIAILSIALIINILLVYAYHQINKFRMISKYEDAFYKSPKHLKFLLMGNSHTFALWSEEKDSAIFYCSYGEDISRSYYRLKYVLDNHIKTFEGIILPYDLGYLSFSGLDNTNTDIWIKYVNFFELGKKEKNISGYFGKYIMGRYFPYAGQEMMIWEYFTSREARARGMEGRTSEKMLSDNSLRCPEIMIDPIALEYFIKLLELCKSNNIRVNLLKYPMRSDYYANMLRCYPPKIYFGKLDPIISKYSNVKVFDYTTLYINNPAKFSDGSHLETINGTRPVFTRIVFDKINKAWGK